jgi:hypothetical protein
MPVEGNSDPDIFGAPLEHFLRCPNRVVLSIDSTDPHFRMGFLQLGFSRWLKPGEKPRITAATSNMERFPESNSGRDYKVI